ncbi:histidine triad (HIT) family protein [Actinopolymorpha cephalotaxi]|uniref:Histidine triad (HIT) family protein n=1 Tax=Actinopolymorpha cephalotaxi TaxID=504797 RepID=A0A1I2ZL48_9ACTN|nr:histidine triad (HIT) family protein [Actinopolymorpha cephalotaxi]SFH38375.1 histidine triad (HIT) family protein [Actinopolymorpha cephalotaxi]
MSEIDVPGCHFCDEVRGRTTEAPRAFCDESFSVFVGRYQPTGPGYALVVPSWHVEDLPALPEDLCGPMLRMARRTSVAVQQAFGATGTTVLQNNGKPGQSVPHLHFHVIPRRPGDGYPRRAETPVHVDELTRQATILATALGNPAPRPRPRAGLS